jgi:hypothetical protein
MVTNILITRVEDDEITRYCNKWLEVKIIPEARKRGFNVIDLPEKKARKKNVENVLKKMFPSLVLFHGHGQDSAIGGYNQEILIHSDENAHLLKDKIIHSFTCNSASILGVIAVKKHNTKTFIGYKNPFIALTDDYKTSRPLEDEIAKAFLDPPMKVNEALIKGNTTGEAFKKSQDLYNYWIAYYRAHGDIKDASDILLYLIEDKTSQVIIGNTDENVLP